MIKIRNLQKTFGQIRALKDVSLNLNPGQTLGLLGPNACGKSTLIKSILGLVMPDAGEIEVNGSSTKDGPAYRLSIGYLPQNPDFPSNLSIQELFLMMEDLRGIRASRKTELIETFQISDTLKRPFYNLSGGTKQKVGIILASMFDAPILIFDEPTAGLDPVSAQKFKAFVAAEASRQKTILLVSHILPEIQELVTHLTFLLDGSILYSGSLSEILSNSPSRNLEDAFIKMLEKRSQ